MYTTDRRAAAHDERRRQFQSTDHKRRETEGEDIWPTARPLSLSGGVLSRAALARFLVVEARLREVDEARGLGDAREHLRQKGA